MHFFLAVTKFDGFVYFFYVMFGVHGNSFRFVYFSAWRQQVFNGVNAVRDQIDWLDVTFDQLYSFLECIGLNFELSFSRIDLQSFNIDFTHKNLSQYFDHLGFIHHLIRGFWTRLGVFYICPYFDHCFLVEANHSGVRLKSSKVLIKQLKASEYFVKYCHGIQKVQIDQLLQIQHHLLNINFSLQVFFTIFKFLPVHDLDQFLSMILPEFQLLLKLGSLIFVQ